ncbi:Periplasmic hemin-binding protein [Klebsiella pneumoniae]|uniref:Periplasmic hemin-binding protein n=1 Tax=Klebsiella pneumoniae TaxID=573 RepID=A0A2X3IL96_KLEPN|nr:Periplasmic hemin-binding protein [Klebsiella pneumoniae]
MPFTRRRAWWRGTAPAAGPPAAQKLPDVGYLRQLNAEGILALRPQLVLASAQAQPSLVLHKVQASGVKVVNVPGGESLSADR